MPRNEKGEYYSRRIDLTDPQEVRERISSAREGARIGGKIGSIVPLGGTAVGTTLGAISGFILGDSTTVFPIDMIAIPSFEYYGMVANGGHTPSFMIYIKEGEVLTQVIPTDAMESVNALAAKTSSPSSTSKKPRKKSKYHAAYGKAFKQLAPKYKLKSGKWAKDGFKRCAAAARKQAKGQVKK